MKQAKALTLHPVLQRLTVGVAIIQAAGLTSLAMLATDGKQLGDDLKAMHLDGLAQETREVQEMQSLINTKIDELVMAHRKLADGVVELMPAENREVMRQMLADTETKVREIVLLGLRSALVAREIFSDEAEFDRFMASNAMH